MAFSEAIYTGSDLPSMSLWIRIASCLFSLSLPQSRSNWSLVSESSSGVPLVLGLCTWHSLPWYGQRWKICLGNIFHCRCQRCHQGWGSSRLWELLHPEMIRFFLSQANILFLAIDWEVLYPSKHNIRQSWYCNQQKQPSIIPVIPKEEVIDHALGYPQGYFTVYIANLTLRSIWPLSEELVSCPVQGIDIHFPVHISLAWDKV